MLFVATPLFWKTAIHNICFCVHMFELTKKLDELLTFSRSAFVKIIHLPGSGYMFSWFLLDFVWIMQFVSNIYLMQAVPFHHLQGVKMITMLWCLRGTWASKNHPFVWPEKRETLSEFVHIQGFIFYIGMIYINIFIYILFILQKSGDHLRCFVFVKYESWEIFQKRIFFVSYQLDQE